MKKICIDCGEEFESKKWNKKNRCINCYLKYYKKLKSRNNKKYREKNLIKINEHLKEYYNNNKILTGKPIKICPLCEIEFISNSNNQKYCQDCRKNIVRKMYNKKQIGKNLDKLSKSYYNNLEDRRKKSSERYYSYTKKPETRLRQIKSGASKRGIEFNISLKWYLENGWNKKCYYCGGETKNGLDRIDNNNGYYHNNCVPCCTNCNIAKRDLTKDEFENMCLNVVKNLKLI